MASKRLFPLFIVFVFLFTFLSPSTTYASCALNEYIGNQCEPPQTPNQCSCYLCWKKWAIGRCNYNGDPNGTLMHSEGYACTYECSTNGGSQDCPFCQDEPACFLPGTKITTTAGQKNIEEIKDGDAVLSFDPTTRRISENTVASVIKTTKPSYYEMLNSRFKCTI
jgi:hypothetical protein